MAEGANPWLDVIRLGLCRVVGLLSKIRERCRAWDVYLSALLIFAASRLVIVIGVKFGGLFLRSMPVYGTWNAGDAWYYRLLRWDSGFYAEILDHGYRYREGAEQITVFYPLYPL